MYYIKKSFSLAEIILTMTIVGSVASFTIPVLIQNVQDATYKIAYKEKFSILSQAFARMRLENGGTLAGVFTGCNLDNFNYNFNKYVNLHSSSAVHTTTANQDWHDYGIFKYLNGNPVSGSYKCSGCISASFSDGSFFFIRETWSHNDLTVCNLNNGVYSREGLCFNVILDVNGKKPPNILGKDTYIISVYKDKTIPTDWIDGVGSVNVSSCTSTGTGAGCGTLYMMQ